MVQKIDASGPSARQSAGLPPVTLHLGAHKTASTLLQRSYLAHREALAREGCAYIGPDLTRRHYQVRSLMRPAEALWRKHQTIREDIAQMRGEGQRILLSDENFLGTTRPPDLALGAQLYPDAGQCLHALITSLGLGEVTVALALRDPLGLLNSAWGHQFLARKPVSFDLFTAGLTPLALRWSELVARLLAVPDVARVILWRFEDMAALAPRLGPMLCGTDTPVPMLEGAHLPGPSARGIEFIQAKLAEDPEFPLDKAVRRAQRRFPKSDRWPGPDPFGAEARAQSVAQYRDDWDQLARMDRVTRLVP